jgi:NADH-quinone oxidoreductase subunit L
VNYIERTLGPVVSEVPANRTQAEPIWLSPKPQPLDGAPPLRLLEQSAGTEVHSSDEIREERLLALLSVLIAACGIGAGWLIFQKRPLLQMPRILENKYYIDEIYDAAIINPIRVGSREGLWKLFDIGVIDGFLHALGEVVTETGALVRYVQAGFVRGYAAIILVGALAVICFFTYVGVHVLRLVP